LKKIKNLLFAIGSVGSFAFAANHTLQPESLILEALSPIQADDSTTKKDTLKFPIKPKKEYDDNKRDYQFDFKDPANHKTKIEYDPISKGYIKNEYVGNQRIGSPKSQSFDGFLEELKKEDQRNYFRQKAQSENNFKSSGIIPQLHVQPEIFDKIFGGGLIDIRPSGSAELTFGGNFNTVRNPAFTARQQKNGQFDFKMKMQVNVTGQIGERMKLNTNYDTEATFEFENQMKLNWQGQDDDILKNIELGNVSLPLNGSLIQGGQSLFGIKTKMQFGRLTTTVIATQQKGETKETEVSGGAQITKFDIQAHNYDVNKHYFLSQFFKDEYDKALSTLPVIQSGILINYVEVWVTNRSRNFNNTRDIMAFMDLGEQQTYNPTWRDLTQPVFPANEANSLFSTVKNDPLLQNVNTVIGQFKTNYGAANITLGDEYNILSNARQLSPQEFTFNERLGYISLNQALNNDEILSVAYEYTYNGRRFQVGELARDNPQTDNSAGNLVLKMVKSALIKTNMPTWDLMMKNIYSLGAYNLQLEDFNLQVVYADDPSGADLNYIPVKPAETGLFEKQLLSVLNLDRMNRQMEARQDGVMDLIEGITVNTQNGRIMFPVREPFGQFLRQKFKEPNGKDADYYAFEALYDSTKWLAEQDVVHNKYFLRGSYKGSSTNEISLNAINVPQGSVKVTANGAMLIEGQDFVVDYTLGKVRIINEGILNSGAVIKVTSESNSLFNIQQKSLVGTRLDYKFSNKLLVGSTVLHMTERPLTPKVNIGEEPILNTIYGFDLAYNTESRLLTRLVDRLPFIETKEKSTFTFNGEFAQIIPHRPKTMGQRGTSYIDDFEGAETPFDLKLYLNWRLASIPQGQIDLFPETQFDSAFNHRRARLSWYTIDPLFMSEQGTTPQHIKEDPFQRSNHFVRSIPQKEVFPQLNLQQGSPQQLPTLDLVYFPKEKGQYNFSTENLDASGLLSEPTKSWAGISRRIETNDFEAANIDYLEVWLMDPFVYERYEASPVKNKGQLLIHLGSISEDILPDNRKSFENGLPKNNEVKNVDTTRFGRISNSQAINNAFDNEPASRPFQDLGFDGLNDDEERSFFQNYLSRIEQLHGSSSEAYQKAFTDPSNDNYKFHRDPAFDNDKTSILHRYKFFNGLEGNSTLDKLADGTPKSITTRPDDEDINQDFTLNLTEEYFQYKIELSQEAMRIGQNYVTDSVVVKAEQVDPGNKPNEITWYQMKIPIREFEKQVGGIQDFKSIRFMRMVLTGFEDSVVLRFAQLQLVRAEWRRYLKDLKFPPTIGTPQDPTDRTTFVVSTVNIEENSQRDPIVYREPPGISREQDPTQPGVVQQNEQSLSLRVCGLKKGNSKGAYKTTNFDIRNYKTIRMYVHAEGENLNTGDARAFIRIGTDLENNYYQYEIPLVPTPKGSRNADQIWPSANEMNIDLEEFYTLKLDRQRNATDQNGYWELPLANGGKVSMIGLPDLSNMRSIMLGIHNPADNANGKDELCAEVWFNELRVTDFANKGGYAAVGRMVTKLADFGTVTASANYQTIGFGGIDKKLNQRNLNQTFQYDISSNFELGKFFPQKAGVTIPMFIGYSETFINPKYYPLNPDILLSTAVKNARSEQQKRQIKNAAQDYTSRYSLNFTNIRKNRTGNSKQHAWDIENFNVSFAYQNLYRRNQVVEENIIKTYKASLGYNYSKSITPWEPFKKIIKGKKLGLIKDLNLYYAPQSVTFRTDIDRRFGELQNRNNDNFKAIVPRFFDKTFSMARVYGVRWDLARSLKFDYASTMTTWVKEPEGSLNTEEKMDTLRRNVLGLGTPQNFNQTMNFNYTLPFNKMKSLNWISSSMRYTANYQWRTAPPAFSSLGNTIQNSRTVSVNANLNFTSFYNKFPALRKMTAPVPANKKKKPTEEEEEGKEKKKEMSGFVKGVGKFVLMFKQAQFTLTKTDGITLPGFNKSMDVLGQNLLFNAPGWDYIMGGQDDQIRYRMAERGLLSNSPLQNNRYLQLNSLDFNGRATIEPFNDFRISLDFTRRQSLTTSSNFRFDDTLGRYEDLGFQEVGQFSIGYGIWNTAFDKMDDEYISDAFVQFKNNRYTVAQRLQAQEFKDDVFNRGLSRYMGVIDDSTKYPLGFSATHQDVLIHAFLSAYSGKNPSTMSLNPFPKIPIPGWRINYNGLVNLGNLKEYFTNISITHAYSSTLNMNSFVTSLLYGNDSLAKGKNLSTKYQYQQGITLSERITPLIGIDITLKNGLTTKFEYKTDRNLALYLLNFQMVEQKNKELVLGLGYRTRNVKLPIKYQGERILLENDLNFRLDFSIRDGVTIVRKLDNNQTNEPTAGSRMLSLRPTLDYAINDKLNFRAFYTRNVNNPKTSQSFPTALTNFGITLRYTMQ
jgi:cell surface protein SprA